MVIDLLTCGRKSWMSMSKRCLCRLGLEELPLLQAESQCFLDARFLPTVDEDAHQ